MADFRQQHRRDSPRQHQFPARVNDPPSRLSPHGRALLTTTHGRLGRPSRDTVGRAAGAVSMTGGRRALPNQDIGSVPGTRIGAPGAGSVHQASGRVAVTPARRVARAGRTGAARETLHGKGARGSVDSDAARHVDTRRGGACPGAARETDRPDRSVSEIRHGEPHPGPIGRVVWWWTYPLRDQRKDREPEYRYDPGRGPSRGVVRQTARQRVAPVRRRARDRSQRKARVRLTRVV
jgi:hypothetical protein